MAALSTLRTRVRKYISEEDSTNSHFTNDELDDYLNQAVTFLGTQMEWPEQVDQASAVAEQTLYELPTDFVALVDVYFDSTKLQVLERGDLGQINPSWQDDESGTPRVVYRNNRNIIGLYPTPDTSQDGKIIQIQYIYLPATLSDDADVPDLHEAFQMCLPFYAAFICDYSLGNMKQSDVHLAKYEYHKKALMSKIQKYSDDLLRFRWSTL